jgi:hypothetical protein
VGRLCYLINPPKPLQGQPQPRHQQSYHKLTTETNSSSNNQLPWSVSKCHLSSCACEFILKVVCEPPVTMQGESVDGSSHSSVSSLKSRFEQLATKEVKGDEKLGQNLVRPASQDRGHVNEEQKPRKSVEGMSTLHRTSYTADLWQKVAPQEHYLHNPLQNQKRSHHD